MKKTMNEKGSVLISVLWIVLVLSLISFSLASTVRVEMDSVSQTFDSEKAFLMAKGSAEIVFNAYSKQQPIPSTPIREENGEYVFPFDEGEARVRFATESGRIDINAASDKVLASMFDSLGLDRETRNRLVDSVLDWIDSDDIPHLYGGEVGDYPQDATRKEPRPRNSGFETLDELLLVRNMTPEIFFGSVIVAPVTGVYRRVPGLRDLVTVRSGSARVDPNEASQDVLAALPFMSSQLAARLVEARTEERFSSTEDLQRRVPELAGSDALDSLDFSRRRPTELVSRATLRSSGVSRTVRILFKQVERRQIIRPSPLLYRIVQAVEFDRWRFE